MPKQTRSIGNILWLSDYINGQFDSLSLPWIADINKAIDWHFHIFSWLIVFLPSATKLRQGNDFHKRVSRILSREGGAASVYAGIHPSRQTPPGRHHPPGKTPPGHTPQPHSPPAQRHPRADPPQQTATTADGTLPTGMHSCLLYDSKCIFRQVVEFIT